jgi:hypothetical protein
MTQTIALLLRMCGADSEQFHLNGAPIALHGIHLVLPISHLCNKLTEHDL